MAEPFLPFTRPTFDEATLAGVVDTFRSGWVTSGPRVVELESALEHYLGGDRRVLLFGHATGALEEALRVLGVGPGDEVIVPAMTFAASANVVLRVGATPVFVDVDLDTRNLTLQAVDAARTEHTRVVMPVHFAGWPVDLDPLYAWGQRQGVHIVEDAAHAIGARYRGRPIGSFGDLVCFSFHANKNMTTIEGGAVSLPLDHPEWIDGLERLRFHGLRKNTDGSYEVERAAGKHNLSDVAARVGLGQLSHLDDFNRTRRRLAERYFERLESNPWDLGLPARGDAGHAWHMFTVRIPFEKLGFDRTEFQARMRAQGIGVGMHYPALPPLALYHERCAWQPGQFPNAERIGRETVTLPLFPAMQIADVDRVVEAIGQALVNPG
ncbi:MAG: DegT/DnrJ/EryC1/StrS family aminotransferase [Gammaproteobacteria bacterium]